MRARISLYSSSVCLIIAVGGCGGDPEPEFAKVEGIVRLNGKPRHGLRVNFLPDSEKGNDWNAIGRGTTDQNGKYSLRFEYKDKEGLGAPVGWNRVIIQDATRPPTPQGQTPPPPLFPPTYGNPATTPLLKEVKPGEQTIDLEITK
jgi:hypothetical protein